MKTPRDIYFEKHSAAEPKLDQIRRAVIDQECTPAAPPRRAGLSWFSELWQEGLRPTGRLVAALAPAWAVVILLNFIPFTESRPSGPYLQQDEMALFLREQRQSMALLDESFAAGPAEGQPRQKPRSEGPSANAAA